MQELERAPISFTKDVKFGPNQLHGVFWQSTFNEKLQGHIPYVCFGHY